MGIIRFWPPTDTPDVCNQRVGMLTLALAGVDLDRYGP